MREHTYVKPFGTSWSAIIGGWVAAIGATTLVAPLVAAILAGRAPVPNDLALAVPIVLGLMIAYLVGGYVAGRMAGQRTSWHGMMTGFFGLLLALVALLVAAAADRGLLAAAGIRSLADVTPGVRQLDLRVLGDTLTFGAILSFLATIFAGWLGGLLAAGHASEARSLAAVVPSEGSDPRSAAAAPERSRAQPRFRLLPAIGRKGGEQASATTTEIRETPIDA